MIFARKSDNAVENLPVDSPPVTDSNPVANSSGGYESDAIKAGILAEFAEQVGDAHDPLVLAASRGDAH
jgi:hypothetical protein